MKVKIGETVYDAKDVPIMVILNQDEKRQITDMHPDATKYCQFPNDRSCDEIREWMNTPK